MDEREQHDDRYLSVSISGNATAALIPGFVEEESAVAENDDSTTIFANGASAYSPASNNNINGSSGGRKRVRLARCHVVVALVEDMTETERDNTWWRQEDFDGTKAHVKQLCRGMRKQRRFSNCLTDAYERACGMNLTDDAIDSDAMGGVDTPSAQGAAVSTSRGFRGESGDGGDFARCEGPSAIATTRLSDRSHFEKSMEELRNDSEFSNLFDDDAPRGLERLSSRLHAMRRQRHLQEVKHAVFLEQARQNIANQRNSESLARQAEFASRKARAFANVLGMGDAWAVANFQQEDEAATSSALVGACSTRKIPSVEQAIGPSGEATPPPPAIAAAAAAADQQ